MFFSVAAQFFDFFLTPSGTAESFSFRQRWRIFSALFSAAIGATHCSGQVNIFRLQYRHTNPKKVLSIHKDNFLLEQRSSYPIIDTVFHSTTFRPQNFCGPKRQWRDEPQSKYVISRLLSDQ